MERYNQRALRKRILERRGLIESPKRDGPRLVRVGAGNSELQGKMQRKSTLVDTVESTYGLPIREVFDRFRLCDIAEATGVNRVTLWRWRKRLDS